MGFPDLSLHFSLEAKPRQIFLNAFSGTFNFPFEEDLISGFSFAQQLNDSCQVVDLHCCLQPEDDHLPDHLRRSFCDVANVTVDEPVVTDDLSKISFLDESALLGQKVAGLGNLSLDLIDQTNKLFFDFDEVEQSLGILDFVTGLVASIYQHNLVELFRNPKGLQTFFDFLLLFLSYDRAVQSRHR